MNTCSMPDPARTLRVNRLDIRVYDDRTTMGEAAGTSIAGAMRSVLARQPRVRMAFAAAPSQVETLAALTAAPGIDWSRVTAFQLDDYVTLPITAPQRFGQFLHAHIFDRVRPGEVHLLGAVAPGADMTPECDRYAALVGASPLDIVCLGIGENGHLAFNDPPVADFEDPALVKPVELDAACREQQVNDGCFSTVDEVPTHAVTLTIPALLGGARLVCVVPGITKRAAVRRTLDGPVTTACPASILRTHPDCTLFLDADSHGG